MRQLLWFVSLACSLNKICRRNCLQRLEITDERTTKGEVKILKGINKYFMIGGRRSGRPWPENRPKGYRKRRGARRNT